MRRNRIVAAAAVAVVAAGIGIGALLGQGIRAGFDGPGPIQHRFGPAMLETTARIVQCRQNYGDQGQPERCAGWWMDADRMAGEMRDAIGALPDFDRHEKLAEDLRQFNLAADSYRAHACDQGFHPQSAECSDAAARLAVLWSEARTELEIVEPT